MLIAQVPILHRESTKLFMRFMQSRIQRLMSSDIALNSHLSHHQKVPKSSPKFKLMLLMDVYKFHVLLKSK